MSNMCLGKGIVPQDRESGASLLPDQALRGVKDDYPELGALEIVADIASEITGFPNPISSIFDIVDKVTEGQTSLWDQLESKVKGKIAEALTKFLNEQVDFRLKTYKRKLRLFARNGKNIDKNPKTELQDRKDLVDDMYDHWDNTINDEDIFSFAAHKASLTFDWGLFDAYIANITHQLLLFQLLIRECEKLESLKFKTSYEKYSSSFWKSKLEARKKLWKKYATQIGPEAAKELFWRGYQCDKKSHKTLLCKDFEGQQALISYSSAWHGPYAFPNRDVEPNGEVAKCTCGNTLGCCIGLRFTKDGVCHKTRSGDRQSNFNEKHDSCGFSYRSLYWRVAQRIYHGFTIPLLNLIGEEGSYVDPKKPKKTGVSGKPCLGGATCSNWDGYARGPWCKTAGRKREECYDTGLSSAKQFFHKDCITPCGQWGGWDSWCIIGSSSSDKTMPYGGYWKYCK